MTDITPDAKASSEADEKAEAERRASAQQAMEAQADGQSKPFVVAEPHSEVERAYSQELELQQENALLKGKLEKLEAEHAGFALKKHLQEIGGAAAALAAQPKQEALPKAWSATTVNQMMAQGVLLVAQEFAQPEPGHAKSTSGFVHQADGAPSPNVPAEV